MTYSQIVKFLIFSDSYYGHLILSTALAEPVNMAKETVQGYKLEALEARKLSKGQRSCWILT